MGSPVSGGSFRPQSGGMNSTINFDFLAGIGKAPKGKFQDKSRIRPVKKLNTEQFHNVIYKVKHQKELLEKEINRMEQWHKDFKENDIWNTPQTAIIDSILRMNARSNPEGNVGRYLQTEKEKEEEMRLSKKFQRPYSSAGFLPKRTPKTAKSVKDFFAGDDNGEEVIEEILSSKKVYYSNYENNKQKITDRIQNFVENMENYTDLMSTVKSGFPREEQREPVAVAAPKTRKYAERNFKESKEIYSAPVAEQGQFISEIVESYEHSEGSQVTRNSNPQVKKSFKRQAPSQNRPFSANVGINTAFSPKNFSSTASGSGSATGKAFFSQGIPSAIHSRPQTAKATKLPPSVTIATGLVATGEAKQQSIGSIKFVPIMMEGQKMNVDAYNRSAAKSREGTAVSRKANYQDEDEVISYQAFESKTPHGGRPQTALVNSSFKSISMLKEESDRASQPDINKLGQKRLMSAKPNLRASSGTQTQVHQQQQQEAVATMGKVNIDGEYFQNYSNGNQAVRTPTKPGSASKQRKDVLQSWVTKENQPYAQYTQEGDYF